MEYRQTYTEQLKLSQNLVYISNQRDKKKMSDIIRDVDESLKKDKLHALWEEYGPTLIISAIALIILTAVFAGWNSWQDSKDRAATEALIIALADSNPNEALTKVANDYSGRLSGLAYLNAGNVAFADGETEQALKSYKALADESDAAEIFQDLGNILYVNLSLEMADEKTVDVENLQDRLEGISQKDDSPWQGFATLLQGATYAHIQGDREKASEILESLRENETTPVDVRAQAITLADFYNQPL